MCSFRCSGVIQEAASARGQIEMAWLVMTETSAPVETHAAVANAVARFSLVTRCVSSVMATAAV